MKTLLKAIICIVLVTVNLTNVYAQNDASSRVNFRFSYGIEPTNGTFTYYDNRPTVTEDGVKINGQIQIFFYLDGEAKTYVENFDSEVVMNKGDNEFKCENGELIYFDGNAPHVVVDFETFAPNEYLEALIEEYERNPTESLVWKIWKILEIISIQS